MNTRIRYLYRDASNYKYLGEIVVNGIVNFVDLKPFLDGRDFAPEDVGLVHPGVAHLGIPGEDDHPTCELDRSYFELTNETGTIDALDLIHRFMIAHAAGWPGAQRDVIRDGWPEVNTASTNTKGRIIPKTCRRCHAVSTGGVYCPNGCGRI